eukprot:516158_1
MYNDNQHHHPHPHHQHQHHPHPHHQHQFVTPIANAINNNNHNKKSLNIHRRGKSVEVNLNHNDDENYVARPVPIIRRIQNNHNEEELDEEYDEEYEENGGRRRRVSVTHLFCPQKRFLSFSVSESEQVQNNNNNNNYIPQPRASNVEKPSRVSSINQSSTGTEHNKMIKNTSDELSLFYVPLKNGDNYIS